jgi:ActR/RegA family two-component response regulator
VSEALAAHRAHLALAQKDLSVRLVRWEKLTESRAAGVSMSELGRVLGITTWAVQQMLEKEPTR